MNSYILDCACMTDRDIAHTYLTEVLPLPPYYGRHLDALYDCLWELTPCTVTLQNTTALVEVMGNYGEALLTVFRDTAEEHENFVLIEEE